MHRAEDSADSSLRANRIRFATGTAVALSLKPGATARRVDIAGGLITHGDGVGPLELNGAIESFQVTDGFAVAGGGFEKI